MADRAAVRPEQQFGVLAAASCRPSRAGRPGSRTGRREFGREPGLLPAADLSLGQALADVATSAVRSERAIRRGEILTEQRQAALNSRVAIEQAKGVLVENGAPTMDAAFRKLRHYTRRNNRGLSDVARDVARDVVDADLTMDVLVT